MFAIIAFLDKTPGETIRMKFIPSQSKLFRFIPISASEPMRIIPNQSEKIFVSWFRMNRIGSDTDIGIVMIGSE